MKSQKSNGKDGKDLSTAAAATIQMWWYMYYPRYRLASRLAAYRMIRSILCELAETIPTIVQKWRHKFIDGFLQLQAVSRRLKAQSRVLKMLIASQTIASAFRGYQMRKSLKTLLGRVERPAVISLHSVTGIPAKLATASTVKIKISVWWSSILHAVKSMKEMDEILKCKKPQFIHTTKAIPLTRTDKEPENEKGDDSSSSSDEGDKESSKSKSSIRPAVDTISKTASAFVHVPSSSSDSDCVITFGVGYDIFIPVFHSGSIMTFDLVLEDEDDVKTEYIRKAFAVGTFYTFKYINSLMFWGGRYQLRCISKAYERKRGGALLGY